MAKPKTIAYLRVSTPDQDKIAALRKKATKLGFTLTPPEAAQAVV